MVSTMPARTLTHLSVSLRLYLRLRPSVVAGDSERPLLLPPVPMSSTASPTSEPRGVRRPAGDMQFSFINHGWGERHCSQQVMQGWDMLCST